MLKKHKITKNFFKGPNEIVLDDNISNGAFRLAMYILTKPDGWSVNNSDIMKKLRIGSKRTLAKYWRELLESGWIERCRERLDDGRFKRNYSYEFHSENKKKIEPKGHFPLSSTNPYLGESGPLNKTDYISNTEYNSNIKEKADSIESTEEDFFDEKDLDSPSSATPESVTPKRASGTRQTAAAVEKPNPSKAFATVFDEIHKENFGISYNWANSRKEFGQLANIRKMIDHQLGDVSLKIKLALFRKLLVVASKDDFTRNNQFTIGGILSQYHKLIQRVATSVEKEPDWPENYDDEMKSKYLSRKEDFKLKYKNIYKDFGYFEPSEVYILSNHTRLYPAARFHVTKRNYGILFKKILQDLESDTFRKQKCSNLFDYVLSEIKKVILPK